MKAYKGFNPDMTCRGFQFEEGKTYEEKEAVLCSKGFHACTDPLDVFSYYPPATSVYHEVELEDVDDKRQSDDSKVCGKKIVVGARLNVSQLVQAAFNFRFERATLAEGSSSATGKDSVALAAGYLSKAKGALGCAICCVERGDWNGKTYPIIAVKAAIVDGETIEADTWYMLRDGEFVEEN